jgi:hypothetical protein
MCAATGSRPSPAVPPGLAGYSATKMGTAGADLWIWNASDRSVTLIAPSGAATKAVRLPKDPQHVDVDAERGIAALTPSGTAVEIYDWDGSLTQTLPLPVKAGDIAWASARQIVVTPVFGGYRAELWDLDSSKLVRPLASAEPIAAPARAGAVRARTTHVRYSAARGELTLVDAFDATVVAVRPDGRIVRTVKAPEPVTPELRQWLEETDANARRSGETFTPSIWQYPAAALGADGSIWLVASKASGTADLVHILTNGKIERKSVRKLQCANLRVAVWDPFLIFFNDPRAPQAGCPEIRRIDG